MNRREEVDRGSEFHRIPGCGCGLRLLTCRPSPGSVVGRAAAFHSWGGGTGRWDENGGGNLGRAFQPFRGVEWNVSSVWGLPAGGGLVSSTYEG
jgi:hypothetical protein